MKICGQVNTPTTNNDPIPCRNFLNSECVIYSDPITYFGTTDPTPAKDVFDLLIQSLSDARGRIQILEDADPGSGGSGEDAAWGTITGTLEDQVDLKTALDDKASITERNIFQNIQEFTQTIALKDSTYIGAAQTNYFGVKQSDVFYFSRRGYANKGFLLDVNGVNSEITLEVPNKSGVIALVSDLPDEYSSVTTTTGDLIVRNSVKDQRVPVGTNGQVLTVDSSSNVGMSWQTISGGGTPITDYVDLSSNQTINGTKEFDGTVLIDGALAARGGFQITNNTAPNFRLALTSHNKNAYDNSVVTMWADTDGHFSWNRPGNKTNQYGYTLETQNTERRNYLLPNASGTVALLSDIPSGGGSGVGGSIAPNQVAVGNASSEIAGSSSLTWNGTDFLFNGAERYIRFGESANVWNGAFIHYEGATNKLHIGKHDLGDTDIAGDINVLTMQRSNGFIGINNESPAYQFDVTGTIYASSELRSAGARIAPTFADFAGRFSTGGKPSFGGSRLGDSDLQTDSVDIGTSLNFIDSTVAQQVNWSIFENNNVMTVRGLGGDHIGVLDLNGGYQAEWDVDDAEATIAKSINFTNGFGYVNDHGVQRYVPGASEVAQTYYNVLISSGGAPRMPYYMAWYDGSTYDKIMKIETDSSVKWEASLEADSIIKTGGTSDDILLGDGTTTSLADLPDQDVGSFTPTVALSTDTQTVGFASGTYVKTGRLLTFTIELSAISTTGTNTNAPTIGGLPFNPASLTTRIDVDLQNSTFTDGAANPIDESRAVIVSVSGTNLVLGYKNNTAASYSPRLTFPGGSGSITLHGSCILLP